MQSNEEVAIKLESTKTKHPQLLYESKIYRYLNVDPTVSRFRNVTGRHVMVGRFGAFFWPSFFSSDALSFLFRSVVLFHMALCCGGRALVRVNRWLAFRRFGGSDRRVITTSWRLTCL